jgi:hypothetical protein
MENIKLHDVVKSGDARRVEILLKYGAIADEHSTRLAILYRHHDVLNVLLKRGASVYCQNWRFIIERWPRKNASSKEERERQLATLEIIFNNGGTYY